MAEGTHGKVEAQALSVHECVSCGAVSTGGLAKGTGIQVCRLCSKAWLARCVDRQEGIREEPATWTRKQ